MQNFAARKMAGGGEGGKEAGAQAKEGSNTDAGRKNLFYFSCLIIMFRLENFVCLIRN